VGADIARAVGQRPDGRILVAGERFNGSNTDIVLLSRNADGTLDTSFGSGGRVTTDFAGAGDVGRSIALQADGRILMAGSASNGATADFALVRYNADGSLDTSFGIGGKVLTAVGGSDDHAWCIAVQPDGKIVVGGTSYNSTHDFALARYNADGSLDTSFSGDGTVITAVDSGYDGGFSVAIQPDGRIVLGGSSIDSGGTVRTFSIARYTAVGALDTSFSVDGRLLTDVGPGADQAYAIALQPDGRILQAGYSLNGANNDFSLVRYTVTGALDSTFSGDGKVITPVTGSGDDVARSLAVQPDGKLLRAGSGVHGAANAFALVRFNADGSLDTGFSGDGKLLTGLGTSEDYAQAVAVMPGGRIVVAGYGVIGTSNDFGLVRYNADGTLDTTFDTLDTLGNAVAFTEGGSPVVLDANAQITDAELSAAGNLAGATLTLVRNGGANGQDQFSATGSLGALTQGGNLVVGGTTIGTVTTNSGGSLVLTFNSNATNTLVNSAMQQIAYANSSDAPPASVQINWTFSDGGGGAQGSGGPQAAVGTSTVLITAVNHPPTDIVLAPVARTDLVLNTATAGDQSSPVTAALPDGGFVAVWVAPDGAGNGIFAQRFDARGLRVGAQFSVTTSTAENQYQPQVASFADGGFVVAWNEQRDGVASWAKARVFLADGTPATGDILVSPFLSNPNEGYRPSVAVLEGDRFVVVWQGESGGASQGVRGRLYGRDGVAQGGEFLVGTTGVANSLWWVTPRAAGLADGGFAVVYSIDNAGSSNSLVSVMNDDGTTRSAVIDQGLGGVGDIARLANGNVVVAYERSSDIFARVYNPSGGVVVAEFQVDAGSPGSQWGPSVAADGTGFTIAWTSDAGDGSGQSVHSRTYDASGMAAGPPQEVNRVTAGDQGGVDAARLSTGSVLLAFSSWRADGNGWAAAASLPVPAVVEGASAGTVVADVGLVVDADTDDVFSYALLDDAGGRFAMDPQNGRITVADGTLLDLETAPWHTLTLRVSDLRGASLDRTVTIGVLEASQQAPVLGGLETAPLAYTENGVPVSVTATLVVSDADSTTLAGATVSIVANHDSAVDVLAFAPANGISSSWDAAAGTLTLSGTASVADYQAALRAVTYRNTSESPSTSARTLRIQVDDGAAPNSSTSNAVTRTVVVTAVNDAPDFRVGSGVVTTAIGTGLDQARAVVVQPDGKVLVAGETASGSGTVIALARYLADGTLDASFGGGDGIVPTALTGVLDRAEGLGLQADGTIVVVG
ncbi:MAG: hypothetical protein ACK57J_02635, partial [Rubrivivax sp.]